MFSHKSEGNIKPGTLIFNQLTPVPEIRLHYRHNLPLIDGETSPLDPLFLNWGGGCFQIGGSRVRKLRGELVNHTKKWYIWPWWRKILVLIFQICRNRTKWAHFGPFWPSLDQKKIPADWRPFSIRGGFKNFSRAILNWGVQFGWGVKKIVLKKKVAEKKDTEKGKQRWKLSGWKKMGAFLAFEAVFCTLFSHI